MSWKTQLGVSSHLMLFPEAIAAQSHGSWVPVASKEGSSLLWRESGAVSVPTPPALPLLSQVFR